MREQLVCCTARPRVDAGLDSPSHILTPCSTEVPKNCSDGNACTLDTYVCPTGLGGAAT
jgi:hypothetical protein